MRELLNILNSNNDYTDLGNEFITFAKEEKNKTAFCVVIKNIKRTNKLLTKATHLGLTMPKATIVGLEGYSYLTFFSDKKYDINIVPPADSKLTHAIGPLYEIDSLSDDYWTIVSLMQKAADTKKTLRKKLKVRGKTLLELKALNKQYKKGLRVVSPFETACDCLFAKENEEYPFIDIQNHYIQLEDTVIPVNPRDNIVILR